MRTSQRILAIIPIILLSSCATYMTPGREADLSVFTNPKVKKAFAVQPAIRFPANLALVRVQASGYYSESARGYGSGAYSVMTVRDIETEKDIETISKLKGIEGVATLNRLLLPSRLSSEEDLCEAAAKLQTDVILIYTIATEFSDKGIIPPLTTLSLGFAPNQKYKITSSASAILMDTKTGYIYGALEEGEMRSGLTFAWGSTEAIEVGRKKAERAALDKLISSFGPFWQRVCDRYRKQP